MGASEGGRGVLNSDAQGIWEVQGRAGGLYRHCGLDGVGSGIWEGRGLRYLESRGGQGHWRMGVGGNAVKCKQKGSVGQDIRTD